MLALRCLAHIACKGQLQPPEINHADQDSQSAATADTQWLQEADAAISRAAVGEACHSGYAEPLMHPIQEE